MVFVKVRETYDLHTIRNKMSVIAVHTPGSKILKRNYPGLLMQCRAYRPVSVDIRLACASMLPVDPQGVGLTEGDVAPEDLFNPILYKAVSNVSMSQIEMFIHQNNLAAWTSRGDSLEATNDGLTSDDFNIYYGLLSNTHDWKHANPQSGLEMRDVVPLVYETLTTMGQNGVSSSGADASQGAPSNIVYGQKPDGSGYNLPSAHTFRGKPQRMPFINTTTMRPAALDPSITIGSANSGFPYADNTDPPNNFQLGVPAPKVFCSLICIPPSRLHQLFYRMVVEWTVEFTGIRPLSEITSWNGLQTIGNAQHVMDYDFGTSKLLTEETELVDTSADSGIKKVM